MGYCKIECPDGKAECCIHCERQEGCDNRCDMMDSYEYAEECEDIRLVDADKLILHLNDYALQESPSNVESVEDRKISRAVCQAIKECVRAVDERPTAFDTDKVISELKRDKFVESECILSDIHQGYNAGLNRAIEIVKGGGADGN